MSKLNEAKETARLRAEKEKVKLAVIIDLLFRFARVHEDIHGEEHPDAREDDVLEKIV